MKKQNLKLVNILLFFLILSSCSSIPKNTADSCSIFNDRYLWYKYAKKTEQKLDTAKISNQQKNPPQTKNKKVTEKKERK